MGGPPLNLKVFGFLKTLRLANVKEFVGIDVPGNQACYIVKVPTTPTYGGWERADPHIWGSPVVK